MASITILGANKAPHWTTLEEMIRQSFGNGRLTRIRRVDNGCNYTACGEYHLTFTKDEAASHNSWASKEKVDIVLNVNGAEWT